MTNGLLIVEGIWRLDSSVWIPVSIESSVWISNLDNGEDSFCNSQSIALLCSFSDLHFSITQKGIIIGNNRIVRSMLLDVCRLGLLILGRHCLILLHLEKYLFLISENEWVVVY